MGDGIHTSTRATGEERVVWARAVDGQISKVHCRPDVDVDYLKERIKTEFKPKFDQWARANLVLKFKGRVLEPSELIDVITDEKDSSGKPLLVIIEAPQSCDVQ